MSTRDNFLDYTFLSHRSQLSNSTQSDVSKSKEYVFDLINTWELNIDLIENMIKETKQPNESSELISYINKIKKSFERKKSLHQEKSNLKGKILIEKQIIEEHKRKKEETDEYYHDQIHELDENIENKDEYIKIFEKKLKEVEIYVHKNTKHLIESKYEVFKDFKMAEFIDFNTDLIKKKENLKREIEDIYVNIEGVKNENNNFKNELNFSFNEEKKEEKNVPNIYNSDICCIEGEDVASKNKAKIKKSSIDKLKLFYNECQNRVRREEMRNKLMKNYILEMTSKFNKFDLSEGKIFFNFYS